MRVLRICLGLVVWSLTLILLLVSAILCVTVILLPLGIPLLLLTKKLFFAGLRLMTSRKVTHPVEELGKSLQATVSR
jgi:hypothetical protein